MIIDPVQEGAMGSAGRVKMKTLHAVAERERFP